MRFMLSFMSYKILRMPCLTRKRQLTQACQCKRPGPGGRGAQWPSTHPPSDLTHTGSPAPPATRTRRACTLRLPCVFTSAPPLLPPRFPLHASLQHHTGTAHTHTHARAHTHTHTAQRGTYLHITPFLDISLQPHLLFQPFRPFDVYLLWCIQMSDVRHLRACPHHTIPHTPSVTMRKHEEAKTRGGLTWYVGSPRTSCLAAACSI